MASDDRAGAIDLVPGFNRTPRDHQGWSRADDTSLDLRGAKLLGPVYTGPATRGHVGWSGVLGTKFLGPGGSF